MESTRRATHQQDKTDSLRVFADRPVIEFPSATKAGPKTCPRCHRSDRTELARFANLCSVGYTKVVACAECAARLRAAGFVLDYLEDVA